MRTTILTAIAALALAGCATSTAPTPTAVESAASPRVADSKVSASESTVAPVLTAICTSDGDVSAAVMPVSESNRISTLSISNDGNEEYRPVTGYPDAPYQNVTVTPFDATRPVVIDITMTDGTHLSTSKTCN